MKIEPALVIAGCFIRIEITCCGKPLEMLDRRGIAKNELQEDMSADGFLSDNGGFYMDRRIEGHPIFMGADGQSLLFVDRRCLNIRYKGCRKEQQ